MNTRWLSKVIAGAAVAGIVLSGVGVLAAPDAEPTFIGADADWLTTVNYFRSMAGLAPVVEDPALSAGAARHSCYMLTNGLGHDEVPGATGYTPDGDTAGNSSNVAVSDNVNATARSHIELWMTGPFHAIGMLRSNLQTVGFGLCANQSSPKWHSAASLDVLRGLAPRSALTAPVLFPGNGSTTNLSKFVAESPDPLPYCGWSGSAGLPVIALMPEAVGGAVSASITGPAGPVQTCALSQLNTDGTAQQVLQDDNAVVAIPRSPLGTGTYNISVSTAARTVNWSFTVDPAAALGPPPAAQATPVGPAVDFTPMPPARVADTRSGFGGSTLEAGVAKRFQIGDQGGVPAGTSAISANFTVVDPSADGFVTVWNCSPNRPVASTSNFVRGEVTPNSGTIPLDASGGLCAFSNVNTDLVIDVNGAYGSTGTAGFTPVFPARTFDTRQTGTRLDDGQTVQLQLGGMNEIPLGVTAVAINVTSVNPTLDGFVTVYPCGKQRPLVSNLNPHPGQSRPNLVITPVSAEGAVCLYALQDVDLVVDVSGYFKSGTGLHFTPSTPFRLTDTRERSRTELQAGTGGAPAQPGQVLTIPIAGVRGVPAGAKAISLNLTVTDAAQSGFINAWPCGPQPPTSTANFQPHQAISNSAQLPLSATGQLCVYAQQGAHIIIDINGWWT